MHALGSFLPILTWACAAMAAMHDTGSPHYWEEANWQTDILVRIMLGYTAAHTAVHNVVENLTPPELLQDL